MSQIISDPQTSPPEPTFENPHVQLDWLLERFLQRFQNRSVKSLFIHTIESYKRLLKESYGYDDRLKKDSRFYLSIHWDVFALYNAEKFWRTQGYASYTLYARVKNLRRIMNWAVRRGLTYVKFFINPQLNYPTRETTQRAAYADGDLNAIRQLIMPEIEYVHRIIAGYDPTGVGDDPRSGTSKGMKRLIRLDGENATGVGWKPWQNIVWYFENVLRCTPLIANKEAHKHHEGFIKAASLYHGGIHKVWRRLGVAPLIDINLIAPLVMKLAWETGLNPESIINLKRDCLRESHPLTGQPYIRYYKKRSTGDKDLLLALFDSPNHGDLPLLPKQSEIIRRTVQLLLDLTEPLVASARSEDNQYLLLFQSSTGAPGVKNKIGAVIRLRIQLMSKWSRMRVKEAKESLEVSLPNDFNLGRFRPTKITKMVLEGHDFFRIQAAAGHTRAWTTWRYIESYQVTGPLQREVAEVLERIHQNAQEFERNPKPYATAASEHVEGVIYKGVLCDCKNVFDPPNSVRRLPVYREGEACTYWNMCLTCPNVLITRKHLPLLVSYHREIEATLESDNLAQVPNSRLYLKIVTVLREIFNDFEEEDLRWAREVAQWQDLLVDAVTYRGIEDDHTSGSEGR